MVGRMTRAKAAEVADKLHIDADALLEIPDENGGMVHEKIPVFTESDRMPLGEMTPNSSAERKKPRKIRGAKGSMKQMKDTSTSSTSACPDAAAEDDGIDAAETRKGPDEEMVKDEREDDVASQAEDTTKNGAAAPTTTLQSAVKSVYDDMPAIADTKPRASTNERTGERPIREDCPHSPTALYAPASPIHTAMPKVIESLRLGTPGKRSASNKENIEPSTFQTPEIAVRQRVVTGYDELEAAAMATLNSSPTSLERSEQQTHSADLTSSHRRQSSRPEDHISALDELDEAVEKVSQALTSEAAVATDQKPRTTRENAPLQKQNIKAKRVPEVRPTRASQARISLAQSGRADFNQSIAARRSNSMSQSAAPRSSNSLNKQRITVPEIAAKRITSATSSKESATTGQRKETIIPHSKPRPVSLSFPTPPPPPKSQKALTTSTFQLPGEAVAAKLKAAREARVNKEAQAPIEKPTFKARPAPSTALKKAPSVRHTTASRARESMAGDSNGTAPTTHKRSSSMANPPVVAKRASTIEISGANGKNSSGSRLFATRPSTTMDTRRLANTQTQSSLVNNGSGNAASAPTTVTEGSQRVPSGQGTVRGKEVFNRAANAQAIVAKQKREKEEAAKKARTEAAERSRQASRAWAENQRLKKLGLKAEPKTAVQPLVNEMPQGAVEANESVVTEHAD